MVLTVKPNFTVLINTNYRIDGSVSSTTNLALLNKRASLIQNLYKTYSPKQITTLSDIWGLR